MTRDAVQAFGLYRKACDGGQLAGCYIVAVSYRSGEGVPRDPDEAVAFFRKACDGGDPAACEDLKAEQ